MASNRTYKSWLIVCFLIISLIYCFHHFISKQIEFVKYADGLLIQDYAYYIIVVKGFWFESLGDIYKLSFQQQAVSAYTGFHISSVMPLGITPIALIVWFPFAYVARFSMALSYTLWIFSSLGVLFSALLIICKYAFHQTKPQSLPIALSLTTLFSLTMARALIFGQTSILATGLLIHLIFYAYKIINELKSGSRLSILLAIFLLGIKPTYLALGLGVLIIYGMWREAIYSVLLLIVSLLCITPFLTTDWIFSYYQQLSVFSHEIVPYEYARAFAPHTMNIFRSAFRNIIGDKIARSISTMVTVGVYIGVIGYSILLKIRNVSIANLSPLKVTKAQLFVLIIGSYLLFAPYAGGYEDLLLLSVFIMALLVGNSPNLSNYKSIALVSILFFILFYNTLPPNKPVWLFWTLKAIILGCMLNFSGFRKEEKGVSV